VFSQVSGRCLSDSTSQSAFGKCNVTSLLNSTSIINPSGVSTTPPPQTTKSSSSIVVTTPPGPTQTGIPSGCDAWVLQTPGLFCADLAAEAGISLSLFYELNPAVNATGECQELIAGDAYCVGTSDGTGTGGAGPTSASGETAPPGPTQAGIPADCNKWELQTPNVFCAGLAENAGIPLDLFYVLNPAVNATGECADLIAGDAYCVGTASGDT
jgi:hypothetical protein